MVNCFSQRLERFFSPLLDHNSSAPIAVTFLFLPQEQEYIKFLLFSPFYVIENLLSTSRTQNVGVPSIFQIRRGARTSEI